VRRLYWRIYSGFVVIVFIFALMLAGLWYWSPEENDRQLTQRAIGLTIGDLLPGSDASVEELHKVLKRLGRRFDARLDVYDAQGRFIAGSGSYRAPDLRRFRNGRTRGPGHRGYRLSLPDGRWIVAHKERQHRPRSLLLIILALALAIAIGAHPLARRITRRLERLKQHLDALGGGDLSARVAVEGRDEVADLARHFNHAAERIEALVEAQRSTLASASHELRTPLTRIRLAVEMLGEKSSTENRASLTANIITDIEELDDLIEELLLASRLRTQPGPEHRETVNLLDLMKQEGGRVGAQVCGESIQVNASPRLLRRLLRNLYENAHRYGRGEGGQVKITASVHKLADGCIIIRVEDQGPGVPEALRERIFEPFFRPPGIREGRDPGVGLGLSLVREIARHYGGDATYQHREGGGSCFEVKLRFSVVD